MFRVGRELLTGRRVFAGLLKGRGRRELLRSQEFCHLYKSIDGSQSH